MAGFRAKLPNAGVASGRSLHAGMQQDMNNVLSNLNNFVKWVADDVTPEVLKEAIEPTMRLSDHYAPKDSHRMVNSRYADVKKFRGEPTLEIGYNRNGEAPYTIFVHEMPQFYHEPPTRYKFLQSALDEDTPEIVGRIAAAYRKRIQA